MMTRGVVIPLNALPVKIGYLIFYPTTSRGDCSCAASVPVIPHEDDDPSEWAPKDQEHDTTCPHNILHEIPIECPPALEGQIAEEVSRMVPVVFETTFEFRGVRVVAGVEYFVQADDDTIEELRQLMVGDS